jgi:hypothetical protein
MIFNCQRKTSPAIYLYDTISAKLVMAKLDMIRIKD